MTRRRKQYTDEDVLTAARDRMDEIWERFDEVWISVSGGKDSGACWNMALDAWERHGGPPGDKPIHLIHFDDEFAYPETHEFIDRMLTEHEEKQHLYWLCFPMKYGAGTTRHDHHFKPWNPKMTDRWIRDIPDAEETYDNVTLMTRESEWYQENVEPGMKHKDIAPLLIDDEKEEGADAVSLTGIRTNESMNRYTAIMRHGGWERNYGHGHIVAYPIYDWTDKDLWKIHEELDWDYNEAYDKLQQLGYQPRQMRTAHPFHYLSLRAGEGKRHRQMWPEEYEKWCRRLEGAQLGFEYGNQYAGPLAPADKTNREYASMLLQDLKEQDEETYEKVESQIQKRLDAHAEHSDEPLRQVRDCPVCGHSWWSMAEYIYEKKYDIILGQS